MTRYTSTIIAISLAALITSATAATAQFSAQSSNAPAGDNYKVELFGGLWKPSHDLTVANNAFGIVGTVIDARRDLGITSGRFPEFRFRLHPSRRHRVRIDYLPIEYRATTVIERRIIFRGIAHEPGILVSSTLNWKTWRFGYEYDLIHRSRGHFGLIVEAKYTDLEASLDTSFGHEFVRARGPIPAIGAVLRVYPLPILGIAGEITAFGLPDDPGSPGDSILGAFDANRFPYTGTYIDFDISGTLNFTRNFGAQFGYRSLDLNVSSNEDLAALKLTGAYIGAVVRY